MHIVATSQDDQPIRETQDTLNAILQQLKIQNHIWVNELRLKESLDSLNEEDQPFNL